MVLNRVVRFDTLSHIAKRPVYVSLEILTGLVAGRELVAPCFSPLSVRVSILTRNKRARRLRLLRRLSLRRLRRLVGWALAGHTRISLNFSPVNDICHECDYAEQ